ncbi:helix-turn-helix protein [Trichococcus patagoniensis]|uniref:Helix-turn-helix protein n=1 Tax=Trichococcus patagoniensis TaxID=382641 RepID=A0A2T5IIZ0_9LACT|nr:helix-turn-helix domain-containing protein [Trichococcus patagoniensis]PTQ83800.1 helix-turn-helix protein [Trichococcus patagoniensis]
MYPKDKKINKNHFDICSSIHNLAKLNVEYFENNQQSSFQLFNSPIPLLGQTSKYATNQYLTELLRDTSQNTYILHTDNFQFSYLGVGLWEKESYIGAIIVGPFLSNLPDETFISYVMDKNNLSLGKKHQLDHYYKSLKVLSSPEYSSLGSLIVTLAANPFINANSLSSVNTNVIINDNRTTELDNEQVYSKIELRYSLERKLMNAVEKGLEEESFNILKSYPIGIYEGSSRNSLRSRKNIAFGLNTVLKLSAERGGVSPIYIHNVFDKFSILIEKLATVNAIDALQKTMISEYCDLVRKLSSDGHSPTIRKAIDYINLNFSTELALNTIADKIQISPFYLSRQFKKETNLSIVEYINRKRIEESKFLIKQNNHSITDIALMVGFQNHNYFCKVFKKMTTLTPKEYLNHK